MHLCHHFYVKMRKEDKSLRLKLPNKAYFLPQQLQQNL